MKSTKLFLSLVLVLAAALPALSQTDIDGNKLTNEVRVIADGSVYSDGRNSSVGTVAVTHRYSNSFALQGVINGGEYFGEAFGGGGLFATINPSKTSYITGGALMNSHTDTTQAWMATIEAGTLVYKGDGFVKGIELDYNQTFKGFGNDASMQHQIPILGEIEDETRRVLIHLCLLRVRSAPSTICPAIPLGKLSPVKLLVRRNHALPRNRRLRFNRK